MTGIEREYSKAIRLAVIDPAHAAFEEVAGEIVDDLRQQVARESVRTDDRNAARAKELFERSRRIAKETIDTRALHDVARRFGHRTSKHQQAQLDAQVRAAIGVEYKSLPHPVTAHVEGWVRENVALIVTVPERYFARLESDVTEAYSTGMHPDTFARQLRGRYDMAANDAQRIARDQVSKLNGTLNRVRQTALGVTGYTWRTMKDNRVRDCHADLDGTEQKWSEPPMGGGTDEDEPGHPGDGICDRCWAEPDFSGLLS